MLYPVLMVIINVISFKMHWRYDAPSLYLQFIPAYPFGLISYLGGFPGATAAKLIRAVRRKEGLNFLAFILSAAVSVPYILSLFTYTSGGIEQFPFFPIEMHVLANLAAAFIVIPLILNRQSVRQARSRGYTSKGKAMLIAEDDCVFENLDISQDTDPQDLKQYFIEYARSRNLPLKVIPGIVDEGTYCMILRHPELKCRMTVIRYEPLENGGFQYSRALIGDTLYGDPAGEYSCRAMHMRKLKYGKHSCLSEQVFREWNRIYILFVCSTAYMLKRRSRSDGAAADVMWKNELRWYRAVECMVNIKQEL